MMKSKKTSTQKNDRVSTFKKAIFTLVVFISAYSLSGTLLPSLRCDDSWQAVLEYAAKAKLQFGKDIIFTYGPLGYLNTAYSQGDLITGRILFSLAWAALVTWSMIGIYRNIPGFSKYVFIGWMLLFFGGGDAQVLLVLTHGSLVLMGNIDQRQGIAKAVMLIIAFAFVSLIKFPFLAAAVTCIILCAVVQAGRGSVQYAAGILIVFTAAVLALWTATGQQMTYLWPWIQGSLEITSGYTEAMSWPPKTEVLVTCLIAAGLVLLTLILRFRATKPTLSTVVFMLLISLNVFMAWKMGFVRGDDHVFNFISFLPVALAIAVSPLPETSKPDLSPNTTIALTSAMIILCIAATGLQRPEMMRTAVLDWPQNMTDKAAILLKTGTGDWKGNFAARAASQQNNSGADLPAARTLVGNATVDVMSYYQWAALANKLNYRPRPVFQGYSAYTPYLQDLNLAFYKSDERPQYVLLNLDTIDFRYATLDDASTLPYILKNYKPVGQEKDFLILKANEGVPAVVHLRLVQERTIAFDETLNISELNSAPLILQVEIKRGFWHKIMRFLYQTPRLSVNMLVGGKVVMTRFVPEMAERGFLINPLLIRTNDIANYYQHKGYTPSAVSFSKIDSPKWLIADALTIRLYNME